MPLFLSDRRSFSRSLAALALFALGTGLSGCAQMGETISPAFADPAKYDLYDCKQLETERKALAARAAELQGLMTKAETGVAGSVVAEVAYRNDSLRCADSRNWPRKPGGKTDARNPNRMPMRRRQLRQTIKPAPAVRGSRPKAGGAN